MTSWSISEQLPVGAARFAPRPVPRIRSLHFVSTVNSTTLFSLPICLHTIVRHSSHKTIGTLTIRLVLGFPLLVSFFSMTTKHSDEPLSNILHLSQTIISTPLQSVHFEIRFIRVRQSVFQASLSPSPSSNHSFTFPFPLFVLTDGINRNIIGEAVQHPLSPRNRDANRQARQDADPDVKLFDRTPDVLDGASTRYPVARVAVPANAHPPVGQRKSDTCFDGHFILWFWVGGVNVSLAKTGSTGRIALGVPDVPVFPFVIS